MRYRDNIEWLKSLKQQIGQTQHRDLWHFEQVIDETIENLKPLAKPHGRLIEEPRAIYYGGLCQVAPNDVHGITKYFIEQIQKLPTIIEAEVSEE